MSRQILCAIDLAHKDMARAIVDRGAELAGLDGAALSIMTVVPDYGMTIVGSYFEDGTLKKAIAAADEQLHAFVDEVLPGHGKVQHITATGSVYEEVLKAADACGAHLILIGANRPDLADQMMGPNAARVARHANVSVMIVRA